MTLMSSMIVELSNDVNSLAQDWRRNNEPDDALARSHCENGRPSTVEQQWQKRTYISFSVDLQEGTCGFPLLVLPWKNHLAAPCGEPRMPHRDSLMGLEARAIFGHLLVVGAVGRI